ncbi:hypothetical protein [Parasphingorhabdus sp.]|uniref:hypothetical protein n=1 Tax=Parasphingorhabdus sp. TaxID=2709688 RepID=UPI0032ECD141
MTHFFGDIEADQRLLSPSKAAEIAALVPSKLPDDLLKWFLRRAAEKYWWDRGASEPPREHVRFQLRMVAHLVWRIRNKPRTRERSEKQLIDLIYSIDHATENLLLEGIAEARPGLGPPIYQLHTIKGIGLDAVYEGAIAADAAFSRKGDYRDEALHKAVAFILWVYDTWTDQVPAFSKSPIGATGKNATRSLIGTSPVATFIYQFFDLVDPALEKMSISSVIEKRLAEVRRWKAEGLSDYHKVANLSDSTI